MGKVCTESPLNKRIITAVSKHPDITPKELAAMVYCEVKTLSKPEYLTQLRNERLIYIARWTRTGRNADEGVPRSGPPIPHYRIGPGPDAPRPKRRSRAEYCRAYRRTKAGKAAQIRRNIKYSGIQAADPLLAALLGVRK